jgi:hypothetical protein
MQTMSVSKLTYLFFSSSFFSTAFTVSSMNAVESSTHSTVEVFPVTVIPAYRCRIKNVGLERWLEEAGQIRKKYFTGKLLMGKGRADRIPVMLQFSQGIKEHAASASKDPV